MKIQRRKSGASGALVDLEVEEACLVRGYILDRASMFEAELALRRETKTHIIFIAQGKPQTRRC